MRFFRNSIQCDSIRTATLNFIESAIQRKKNSIEKRVFSFGMVHWKKVASVEAGAKKIHVVFNHHNEKTALRLLCTDTTKMLRWKRILLPSHRISTKFTRRLSLFHPRSSVGKIPVCLCAREPCWRPEYYFWWRSNRIRACFLSNEHTRAFRIPMYVIHEYLRVSHSHFYTHICTLSEFPYINNISNVFFDVCVFYADRFRRAHVNTEKNVIVSGNCVFFASCAPISFSISSV